MRSLCIIMFLIATFSYAWPQMSSDVADTCANYEIVGSISHNFGDVSLSSDSISHSFLLISTGDVPLIVISRSTTCPCTNVYCSQDIIMKGDTLEAKVVYHPYSLGRFNQSAVLKTNIYPYKYVRLCIEGNVVEEKDQMQISNKD